MLTGILVRFEEGGKLVMAASDSYRVSEAAEQMSAIYLVEATAERAHELAERILDPHVGAIEVRPVQP